MFSANVVKVLAVALKITVDSSPGSNASVRDVRDGPTVPHLS